MCSAIECKRLFFLDIIFMQVIIVWNDVTAQVPEDLTRALPKDKLFIMRPKQNSLQNFFLPMDLIRTDAVLTMDDDVRVSNFDLNYAFRQEGKNCKIFELT